ncbi:MAG: ATP-binding cassette domain-containing protein [Polyangiaceae bacterium]
MSEIRCRTRGVMKKYGETSVLKGVDLEISEGEFAVLVGPSGCGKSTLLRSVAGLEDVDQGTIELAGKFVTHLPPRERNVAMVFQSYALYPHLTVRQNLAFGLELRGTDRATIEARVKEASDMLGLGPLLGRLPKELSGGQRQRVAMGRVLVRRANLYLFDEPLSNLDAALRAEVRVEIRKLHDKLGATSLYVTHDQTEAMTLADTLWVLRGGVVEQKGAPLDVYERPRSKFVAAFVGSPRTNFFECTLAVEGGYWFAEGDTFRFPLPSGRFRDLENGKAVTVGVRPQDLRPRGDDEGSSTSDGSARTVGKLTVDVVEILGSEAFVYGTAGSAAVISGAGVQRARSVVKGSEVELVVAPTQLMLFDRRTEQSLDAS